MMITIPDDLDEVELGELIASVRTGGHLLPLSDAEILKRILSGTFFVLDICRHCRSKKVLAHVVGQRGILLIDVPDHMRTRDVCMAAVRNWGWALAYVPPLLRDKELCMEAMRHGMAVMGHVPEPLKASIKEELGHVAPH